MHDALVDALVQLLAARWRMLFNFELSLFYYSNAKRNFSILEPFLNFLGDGINGAMQRNRETEQ